MSELLPDSGQFSESTVTTDNVTEPDSPADTFTTAIPETVTKVSVYELKQKLEKEENVVLLDVRQESSFDTGHIEGAISIPIAELSHRYQEIPLGLEVIVYSKCA